MRKLDILFVCGAGLGSSFACQMAAEDVLNKLGVEANLDHDTISSAVSRNANIIITGENFKSQFDNFTIDEENTTIVYLKNIVSTDEIEEKIIPVLKDKGII
ncbi:PTS sugar transporter subunit IIB [Mammaliicoccus lentus]|uniref:PTS sugar transporter subunit IIB n=1 Tax=Mammaliicoccus lentus TaxID=42858 RepID=UPI000305C036|nr:PTS sugar transporter subunit IIB [Mammaliicoccus lentus]WQL56355.1 PTS sugar transporter subunit IIB [Mammaliicoccus lentus]SCU31365.1 PTS family porter component IIB [Mammaliicoccus lentus]HLQ82795.1 PTS sugar transporter subunit IIB [Pseudogracilibacillus sp.]